MKLAAVIALLPLFWCLPGAATASAQGTEVSQKARGPASPQTLPREGRDREPDDNDPLKLGITYTADIWGLARGEINRGVRYLDNVDLTAEADLDALAGMPRTTLFLYGLYNNGRAFSGNNVGDAQVISNIETGVRAVRLYEAWLEHEFGGDLGSAKFGLYDLNSEFDALETSSLFLGSAHGIGTDFSQTGQNGPSIFPSTSLAARLELRPVSRLTVRAAVLDGVPNDPDRPRRTRIKLGFGDGALLVGEVDYAFSAGRVIAGYWRYTARFEDQLATALTGVSVSRRGNEGAYLRAEHRLWAEGDLKVNGFGRLGVAKGRYNQFGFFGSAGLTATGWLPGRPNDQSGVAVALARASRTFRQSSAASFGPVKRHELALELTHHFVITDWLALQPDVQYVVNPGLAPNRRDAFAFGLRFEIGLSE